MLDTIQPPREFAPPAGQPLGANLGDLERSAPIGTRRHPFLLCLIEPVFLAGRMCIVERTEFGSDVFCTFTGARRLLHY